MSPNLLKNFPGQIHLSPLEMDLRLANNSQGGKQLILRIKPYLLLLKLRLFNDKFVILFFEMRI
jgi:hypothetical protein